MLMEDLTRGAAAGGSERQRHRRVAGLPRAWVSVGSDGPGRLR
jgi:hypothetical protein